jgi:hypothetical protein
MRGLFRRGRCLLCSCERRDSFGNGDSNSVRGREAWPCIVIILSDEVTNSILWSRVEFHEYSLGRAPFYRYLFFSQKSDFSPFLSISTLKIERLLLLSVV